MDKNALAKVFFDFEKNNRTEIGELEVEGINAWQIIKYPLYQNIIQAYKGEPGSGVAIPVKNYGNKFVKSVWRLWAFFISFFKLLLKAFSKRKSILFYAFAGDKLVKDEQGNYFNFLMDSFVTRGIVSSFIYVEQSVGGDYKRPSPVPADFKAEDLNIITSLYIWSNRKSNKYGVVAERLYSLLERKLSEQGSPVQFSVQLIEDILTFFYAEYKASILFFRICRPAFIITSERPGTGLLAAANKLKIKSLDLQHGVIDKYHPQYIHYDGMKTIKNKMALPSFVGVFGEYHKKVMLKSGFWEDSEIVILGSARVEMNRERYSVVPRAHVNNEKSIIIPTQWTFFNELKHLLKILLEMPECGFKVVLKIHPLEPKLNAEYFYNLMNSFPGRLYIADKNEDIYILISNALLVIGFDSAVLLESVSLMKPCITVTTESSPDGIHSLYHDDELKKAIRPVSINDNRKLEQMISEAMKDSELYYEWLKEVKMQSNNLYAESYLDNCRRFISIYFSKN